MKNNLHTDSKSTHTLTLIINDKKYEWNEQYITGAQIRNLGGIEKDQPIFLAIKKPWEDEPISDDTRVDLARPGIEHFYSIKCSTIIVNTRDKEWSATKISYEEVVRLAFPAYVPNGATEYSVTYSKGPKENPSGTMVAGDSVFVKHKMNFNVTATNRS